MLFFCLRSVRTEKYAHGTHIVIHARDAEIWNKLQQAHWIELSIRPGVFEGGLIKC